DCTGSVAVGETKTCTVTNDDVQQRLTLIKRVVTNKGGTLQVPDFPLFVNGTSVASGVANGVKAGTYTASETQKYGYSASFWGGDCNGLGSVTLSVGDNKSCTITNSDLPGTIIVTNMIRPAGSLTSFGFGATGSGYVDF